MDKVQITDVVFDEKEIEALRVIAQIDCHGINCTECPFDWEDGKACIKGLIREMMMEQHIPY